MKLLYKNVNTRNFMVVILFLLSNTSETLQLKMVNGGSPKHSIIEHDHQHKTSSFDFFDQILCTENIVKCNMKILCRWSLPRCSLLHDLRSHRVGHPPYE